LRRIPTTIALAPASLVANSRLPVISVLTKFPAMRAQKISRDYDKAGA